MDNKITQVALDGLENILKVGEADKEHSPSQINQYALFIEEAGGMEKIHNLQLHDNIEIYKKAYNIIDKYFAEEGEDEDDNELMPEVDHQTGQFNFEGDVSAPQGGFNFGN
ncbi:Importin subunit alpha-1 [Kickxella alabastrina]|uniref:Importin subunit alpha-1 n=2 Tax=Kickxella alabastrina TaxID=61397 RepID=A0ACC1ISG9_9FUNG|nr:Importin subunit alpha-1 [Kickxella alabastrina]KAJ1900081.1 Importin subunit alpha-1 [Kickxella alabastrina]